MPTFAFRAVSTSGTRARGVEHAASAGALARTLEGRGLLVLDIRDAAEGDAAPGARRQFGSRREVLELTRALSALLPAGLPLAQALGAAAGVTTGPVERALQEVRARIERGETLAVALAAFPALFSPMYVGVVRAGERSGDLDTAFARLATQLERDEALRGRVLSASIYPLLLAVAGVIAVTVLLAFVLPQFAELLAGTGAQLPTSTRLLLAASTMLRRVWPLLLLVPAALLVTGVWMQQSDAGRRTGARLLLALPLIGTLRRYALAARFARLLGVLVGGGAPLLMALDDTVESLGDPVAREHAEQIRTRIREGSTLRAAVAQSSVFPPLLAQLIGVGEEAGQLREFLMKAADIFEERTERATQRVATLAEPAMIVVFGAIVAVIALSLLQAIYGINASSFS
jgi:general secretion pathway protein F